MRAAAYVTLTLLLVTSPGAADPPLGEVDVITQVLRLTVTIEGDGVYGAGILIDPRHGLVLTSLHVVEEMKQPRVTSFDGRSGVARVLASNKDTDLAMIAVDELRSPDLMAPRFADPSQLRPGEEVFAIGSPRKLPFTVTHGLVSYVGREMEGAKYLQLDMAINDGNSGGPVFTRDGRIVGVMSFILRRSQGLAFALPIGYAASSFPQLIPRAF